MFCQFFPKKKSAYIKKGTQPSNRNGAFNVLLKYTRVMEFTNERHLPFPRGRASTVDEISMDWDEGNGIWKRKSLLEDCNMYPP